MSDIPANQQAQSLPAEGGLGGVPLSERHERHDLKLIERSLTWDVPEKTRLATIGYLTQVLTDKGRSDRKRMGAAKILMAAHNSTLKVLLLSSGVMKANGPNVNMLVNGDLQLDFSKLTNDQLQALIALRQQLEASEQQTAQSAGGLPGIQLPPPTSDQAPPPTPEDFHAGNGHAGHP